MDAPNDGGIHAGRARFPDLDDEMLMRHGHR
jgi:hypothetical protein